MYLRSVVAAQRHFFLRGSTHSLAFRKEALAALRLAVTTREKEIEAALMTDLHMHPDEIHLCEMNPVLRELAHMEKNLARYMRREKLKSPSALFPAHSFTLAQPKGVCLVLAPAICPFSLSLLPLIGAVAAGNCVVLKPSARAPQTAALLMELLEEAFPQQHVCVLEGDREENERLLDQNFDHVFCTGTAATCSLVMEKAARQLATVTLLPGGKSPCFVDETADLHLAAKRLVSGKFLRAGQLGTSPDYLLIHECVKDEFLEYLAAEIDVAFGAEPLKSPRCVRIPDEEHYRRLVACIADETTHCIIGGTHCDETSRLSPTVLDGATNESAAMQLEVCGPLLPVLTFFRLDEAIAILQSHASAPALYLFTAQIEVEAQLFSACAFGSGCVNDTLLHAVNHLLPAAGICPRGKQNFDAFTRRVGVVKRGRFDRAARYRNMH